MLINSSVDNKGHDYRLISQATLEDATREQWDGVEVMTHRHFRYGTGFMLNNSYFKTGNNPRSFGYPGLGGANAFADPDAQVSFGYYYNRIHPINKTGPCATNLIEALYRCIESLINQFLFAQSLLAYLA